MNQILVATTDLRADLNLETIQHQVRNAEYNPAKFAACVIRIREPRATALVFESGKMVVTGSGCWEDAKKATIKFGRAISKLGFSVSVKPEDLKLSNVVASCDVKFAIKLEGLAYEHGTSHTNGGALFVDYAAEVLVEGTLFKHNSAKNGGGARLEQARARSRALVSTRPHAR